MIRVSWGRNAKTNVWKPYESALPYSVYANNQYMPYVD